MNRERALWMQATGPLLEELIGVHQRVHAAFGQKLERPYAFPLFQGKRRNRTIIYNAEYGPTGKLRRGVFFITTGSQLDASSKQWSIGRGWRQWSPTARHLERLSGRIYDAVEDEFNLDLAPLKLPIKLVHWVDDLAAEFAQRNGLPPDHPQVAKCLRQIFVRGGHETVESGCYELPHEGLGGLLVAYALAACRNRVDRHWAEVAAEATGASQQLAKAPQLWIHFSPEAREGTAMGFPHPSGDSPGGIQLATYPRPGATSSAEVALNAVTGMPVASIYQVVASFPVPARAGELSSWSELLDRIGCSGPDGARVWNLAQPEVMATAREAIKAWDRAFTRWSHALKPG
ncbi:MAG: hypothetical protein ACYC6Y_01855 [Thermoguttaceae bacterium]